MIPEKTCRKITSPKGLCQADVEETLCMTLNMNDLVFGSDAGRLNFFFMRLRTAAKHQFSVEDPLP